jgi:hypothetical protein
MSSRRRIGTIRLSCSASPRRSPSIEEQTGHRLDEQQLRAGQPVVEIRRTGRDADIDHRRRVEPERAVVGEHRRQRATHTAVGPMDLDTAGRQGAAAGDQGAMRERGEIHAGGV